MAVGTGIPVPGRTSPGVGGGVDWISQFVSYVVAHTGLRPDVVRAWVKAEGGKSSNPLNIRNPRTGNFDPFASTTAAAQATVAVINQPNMAAIRRGYGHDAATQLAGIANSPWDAGHYTSKTRGDKLRGAYNSERGGHSGLPGAARTGASAVAAAAGAVADPIGSAISGVEAWAGGAALRTLAYLVLTVLAIVLFVLGLERVLGPSPMTNRNLALEGAKYAANPSGIPY